MSCKHTIGTAVDWNGCCISCGADLNPIAMAEARKKPGPTEFTKEHWKWFKGFQREDYWMPRFIECLKEIDRLTAELARLKGELTCEECEENLEDPETGVTAICIGCWSAMVTKLRAEIDSLTAENKDKNEEIEKLASHLLAIDNYCRVNDIDIEQALKGE